MTMTETRQGRRRASGFTTGRPSSSRPSCCMLASASSATISRSSPASRSAAPREISSIDSIELRFATAYPCWHGGGGCFTVHHKALYRAIGEPDNRHRRRPTMSRAIERLMLLDTVLAASELTWLATEREKVEYFDRRNVPHADLPSLMFEQRRESNGPAFPRQAPDRPGLGGR